MACVDDAVLGLTPDLLRRVVLDLADEHSPAGNATVAVMAIAERLLAACSGLASTERAEAWRASAVRSRVRSASARGWRCSAMNDEVAISSSWMGDREHAWRTNVFARPKVPATSGIRRKY
jgi:hypothetical protein